MISFLAKLLPFRKHQSVRQFYKFAVVGVANTAIDFLIYLALTRIFSFFADNFVLANIISFSVAVSNSFYWNRKWTFRSVDERHVRQYMKFFIVNVAGLGINTAVLYLLVTYAGFYDVLAKVIAIGVALFWNFFVNRMWVFREKK